MVGPAVHLEVVAGNAVGMSILVEDELVIGRHAEGAGRLADDEEISRAHARVTVDERGSSKIEDLGSTNGTFVNALRISAPHQLSMGDTIELGGTTLVVRELPRAEPEPAPGEAPPALQPSLSGTAVHPTDPPPVEAPLPAPAAPPPPPEPGHDFTTQPYEPADDLAPPAEPPPEDLAPPAEPPPEPLAPPVEPPPEDLAPPIERLPEPRTAPDEPVPQTPPLRIALEIDFANQAAMIELDGEARPVQLVLDSGRWKLATPPD
jgi:hypothetical protein